MPETTLSLCPLFANLLPEECFAVSKLMTVEKYVEGDEIISQGDETRALWLISEGSCQVQKDCGNGHQQLLATLEPNSVFGEMSFFRSGPHSATVVASNQVECLVLTRENFTQLQNERPAAALKVTLHATRLLIDRLRKMDNWACQLVAENDPQQQAEILSHHEWREFQTKLYTEWNF